MTYQNYLKRDNVLLPIGSVEVRWKDAESTCKKEHDIKPRQMTLRFNNDSHTYDVDQQTNILHTLDGKPSVFKWVSYFKSEEYLHGLVVKPGSTKTA